MLFPSFFNAGPATYEIEQSLRFDRSSYLSRTFTTGNGRIWSLSVWLKRAGGIGDNDRDILGAYTGSYPRIGLVECGAGPSSDHFGIDQGGPSGNGTYYANGRRRDPSAWYHLVISVDYNSPSAKIWVNGVLEGAASNSLAADGGLLNSAIPHEIGGRVTGASTSNRWDGYMAEFHFLDTDSQLSDPYDFGEFDDNGVWRPIEYTGSHGDAGFYLKFDPTATNGIGHDHSGNGNNFTPTGFTTSGTGTDVMSDTPTNNWATLNPNDLGASSFDEGNLVATANSSGNQNAGMPLCTIRPSSGKYYAEMTVITTGEISISAGFFSPSDGDYRQRTSYYRNGAIYVDQSGQVATGASFSSGSTVGIALDLDNQEVRYVGPSGQNYGPYDISGINEAIEYASIAFHQGSGSGSCRARMNYGQRAFAHTPPTGFVALNTSNLPAPTVKDGSEYFNTVLYTGNTSTQSITGVGFQPDFVWAKDRTNANEHALFNSIVGAGTRLSSNLTAAEITDNTTLTSFDTDGFSLGSDGSGIINRSTRNYVAWNWLAGGSGSSNTDGSITSTVSASPSSGFSVVSYTGTGSAATVGHGLGVAPSAVIVKNRDDGTKGWPSQFTTLGNNYVELNSTTGTFTGSGYFNNTAPTSTVFSVGTIGSTNASGDDFIAYCFAEVEGYSKIGTYTGNGDSDGPFVYCGFQPSWVMFKHYSGTITYQSNATWNIYDAVRDTYNVADAKLMANASDSEATSVGIDILSNGFKLRGAGDERNKSGGNYLFVAFASNPFGGDGVSPATAR